MHLVTLAFLAATLSGSGTSAAQERLCDPSFEDCRAPLIELIRKESVAIEVAFWFMEDARYSNEIIKRWQLGVPVRVIVDPRANETYPLNGSRLAELAAAGIPMRKRIAGGILHWKMMLFSGQDTVEFSGANYSPWAFAPVEPYRNYTDEAIYFSTDPLVVNSFRAKYDALWLDTTSYADYANIIAPLVARYDSAFLKDPALNFPPEESFRTRSIKAYDAEAQAIDVTMFRITDRAHSDALIRAVQRGVPVRLITDPTQYRLVSRYWHAWNVDRMYTAGIKLRLTTHAGVNHQKSTMLKGQGMTIFGSSNWTSPSSDSQQEHNYFTKKPYFMQWFTEQFERKWTNATGNVETGAFVPLPPDKPLYESPVNVATEVPTTGMALRWLGGFWAHTYDVYFGVAPDPPLLATDVLLGPSTSPREVKEYRLPDLQAGTTYYWRVVSKTMANVPAAGAIRSFTTSGSAPSPPPPGTPGPGDIVLHAAGAAVKVGSAIVAGDATAAGANRMEFPDQAQAKIMTALDSPASYFELTFDAQGGVPYHLWIRGRAARDAWANDSVYVQFSGSIDGAGSPLWLIGSSSGAAVNLEDCSGCGISGWGWQDNGYGANVLGPDVSFAQTGPQTIRVQVREDGLSIDQIVLSPSTFRTRSPGALKNDTLILPAGPSAQ